MRPRKLPVQSESRKPEPVPTLEAISRGWQAWEAAVKEYIHSTKDYKIRPAVMDSQINPHRFGQ